jgi:hypothetical protein
MKRKAQTRVDLLQGTLDLLILRTLLFGANHGHAIARHIQRSSEDLLQIETGSLYPALHRLEAKGSIEASWELSEKVSERSTTNSLPGAKGSWLPRKTNGTIFRARSAWC